jgi:TP901 family phage tail tape measure protein
MGAIGDIFFRGLFEDSQFTAEAKRVGSKMGDTAGRSMGQRLSSGLARTIGGAAIGTAVAGGLQSSIVAFGAFEQRMNEVFTLLPGISQKAMGQMQEDVKAFARETGKTTEQVIPALYQAISAGIPPDNVFDFLRTANKNAVGGVADLETSVNGLTSVVNAYGSDVLDAATASDIMFTGVRLGKTTIAELSDSLFQVIPNAAALGVSFGDVTAALVSMTAQGVPTRVATTQLRQLFVELSKDTSAAAKMFKELSGKSFKEFIAAGGNVQDALVIMEKGAADSGKAINDMFGSVEAGAAALALTGKGAETLTRNLDEMGQSVGATDKAFEQMAQGGAFEASKFAAKLETLAIDVGQVVSKFGPLPQIIASTFGPSMARAIGAGLGGLVGLVGPRLASALAGLLPTAVASGTAQGVAMGGAAATSTIATQTAGVVTGQAAVAAGAAPAAAAAGTTIGSAMGTAAGAAFRLLLGAAVILGVALAAEEIHKVISREGGLAGRTKTGKTMFADELAWPFGPKNTPKVDLGPFKNILGGDSAFSLDANDRTKDDTFVPPKTSQTGGSAPDDRENEWTSGWSRGVDKLHEDLIKAIAAIKATDDPKALADAIGTVLKSILGGEGNAAQTTAVIAELEAKRAAALARGDTATATLFANAIAKIEPFAKGRQWQAEQINEAKKIVASNKSTADKVTALKGIQQDLLSHNRTMAAGIIGQQIKTVQAIDKLPVRIKNALGGILFSGSAPGKTEDDTFVPPKKGKAQDDIFKPGPINPGGGVKAPMKGFGGAVNANQPYLVGDRGVPELYVPRASGNIVPAANVPGMAGGNTTINVPITGLLRARDPFEVATQLKRLGDFGVLSPRREPA